MSDTTGGLPTRKKRSLFKRAAWQDADTKDGQDMFSHANEFKDIVAQQQKRSEEERKLKATDSKLAANPSHHREKKRRRISSEKDNDNNTNTFHRSNDNPARTDRAGSSTRNESPFSPALSPLPAASLSARYEALTRTASPNNASRTQPVVIDLGDSDDNNDGVYNSNNTNTASFAPPQIHGVSGMADSVFKSNSHKQNMAMRQSWQTALPNSDNDDVEEVLDPTLAALAARARERAAISAPLGGLEKAPIAQLLINPEIPDAKPMMIKVRIDHTLERARLAWCGRQGYSQETTKGVFLTWRGTRLYDSTTVKRLGIQVDANGNVSVEGDANIYDEDSPPKVHVEAWTEETYQQRKKEDAVEQAVKRQAVEPSPIIDEQELMPQPPSEAKKVRLILKAKGKGDFKIVVNPDTSFGHIAHAYKQQRDVDEAQPITLLFDGDRLSPIDTIAESEIEDMDSIDVLFK